MGAVNFSIDSALIDVLTEALSLDVFVETGTFEGDSINLIKDRFSEIYSIELSSKLHEKAQARFKGHQHIKLIKGDSAEALFELGPKLRKKSALYFLDAHWCCSDMGIGESSQCPLVNELGAIGTLNEDSVIVIDDARLFISTPPLPYEISEWPSFSDLLDRLRDLSSEHALEVINDNIIFYPKAIESAVREFSQNNEIDWLSVLDQSRDYENIQLILLEKENEIDALKSICDEREKVIFQNAHSFDELKRIINEKQKIIEDLHKSLGLIGWVQINLIRNPYHFLVKKLYLPTIKFLFPLGILQQHPPKPFAVPKIPQPDGAAGTDTPPTISIVTPSYNQGKFIERTINSVLDQDYPALEYVVQDGGSSDGTPDILRRYGDRLKHWEAAKDGGQTSAVNTGFGHTTGEIMAYLNSDDMLLPGALNYVAGFFASHPDVDVIYGNRVLINEFDDEIGRWVLPSHSDDVLSWVDYVPQETLFWRRSIWEKAGGKMDESFQFALDWDLLLRFRDAGAKFMHLPRFFSAFRVHPEQKTSASLQDVGAREINRLRKRCLGRLPSNPEINRAIRPYLLRHMVTHRLYRLKEIFGS